MPTFYSAGVSIQLSTALLKDVVTVEPSENQSQHTSKIIKDIAEVFSKSTINNTLNERLINEPHTSSPVRFLGPKQDMPFILVQTTDIYEDDSDIQPTRRPARVLPSHGKDSLLDSTSFTKSGIASGKAWQKQLKGTNRTRRKTKAAVDPCALCVSLFLSPKSFGINDDTEYQLTPFCDLKVDIFLNGELMESTTVSSRYRSLTNLMDKQVLRFTGQRTGRMFEKPLIFAPPDMKDSTTSTAESRWVLISDRLQKSITLLEKAQNIGRSVLREYLDTLCDMKCPVGIDSSDYGVIDVVVCYGSGSRNAPSTPYLTGSDPVVLLGLQPAAHESISHNVAMLKNESMRMRRFLENHITSTAKDRSESADLDVNASTHNMSKAHEIDHLIKLMNKRAEMTRAPALQVLKHELDLHSARSDTDLHPRHNSTSQYDDIFLNERPVTKDQKYSSTKTGPQRYHHNTPSRFEAARTLLALGAPQQQSSRSTQATSRTISHSGATIAAIKARHHSLLEPVSNKPEPSRSMAVAPVTSSPLTPAPSDIIMQDNDSIVEDTSRPIRDSKRTESKWITLKSVQKRRNAPRPSVASLSLPRRGISPRQNQPASQGLHDETSPSKNSSAASSPLIKAYQYSRKMGNHEPLQSEQPRSIKTEEKSVNDTHANSRVRYADDGLVRTASSIRGGWFKEQGVLLGVRFIVG